MGPCRCLNGLRATRAISSDRLKLEGGARRPQGRSPFRSLAYARRVQADEAAR